MNNAKALLDTHAEVPESIMLSDIQVCIHQLEKCISKLELRSEKVKIVQFVSLLWICVVNCES